MDLYDQRDSKGLIFFSSFNQLPAKFPANSVAHLNANVDSDATVELDAAANLDALNDLNAAVGPCRPRHCC